MSNSSTVHVLNTSTHKLELFEGEGDEPIYFRTAQLGAASPGVFTRLNTSHDLETEPSPDRIHVVLKGESLGDISTNDEEALGKLADFVSIWKNSLSSVMTKAGHPGGASTDGSASSDSSNGAKLSFAEVLDSRKLEFTVPSDVKLRIMSWNLQGLPLTDDVDVAELLDLPKGGTHDLYILGIQESDPLGRSLYANPVTLENTCSKILSALPESFQVLAKNQLLGLMIIVFAEKSFCTNQVNEVKLATTGTGLLGVWGNKGAAMIELQLPFVKLKFINCHLSAGEKLKERRYWELGEISKKFGVELLAPAKFIDDDHKLIFDSDIPFLVSSDEDEDDEDNEDAAKPADSNAQDGEQKVNAKRSGETLDTLSSAKTSAKASRASMEDLVFVFGDLNYRISEYSREQVEKYINNKDYDLLLVKDQLRIDTKDGKIFRNFKEPLIRFPATYKFVRGTGNYDASRTPAYTDRILYSDSPLIGSHSYTSGQSYVNSDHRPVMANLVLDTRLLDLEQRSAVAAQVFKSADKEENSHTPVVDVEPRELSVEDCKVLEPESTWITITNKGPFTNWEVLINQDGGQLQEHIQISPSKGILPRGASQKIKISCTLDVFVNSVRRIAVVRLGEGIQDIFVPVEFKSLPSCLGTPLEVLVKMPEGVRKGVILDDVTLSVPKEFSSLIDYLSSKTDDMFNGPGEQSIEIQVQEWLDTGKPLDVHVLDAADEVVPGIAAKSVSHRLELLARYIPGGIISGEFAKYVSQGAEGVNGFYENASKVHVNVVIYLSAFIGTLIRNGTLTRARGLQILERLLFERKASGMRQRAKRYQFLGAICN